ncbi:NAD-dependent protein deacetylase sirtuin-2 [Zancudomyces culisetae]|uniref:NAD-dependent protein deacetylase sirtuin-2 n=1 Tax=Zancudomyces culisetae TaxID=1213189 RepID=A0A1R1PSZ4_ZANCU|nr:NAD-dependent protein deacetylase sirtuin-2 [Zancudomyces culisetae]|eukprot:OMH84077.1 NAD-dependent protein deacetylase sirtuin-2 [Zancudomyces culisetae]
MSEEGSSKVKPDNIKQEAEESVLELAKGLEVGLKLDDTTEKKVQIEKPKEEKTEKASLKFKGLPDSSIESIAEYIKSGYGKNIIILSGAGISTSAGIPDFRSPKTGLYANLKKYNLPYPEAIFVLSYFADKPEPFFTLAKELYPGSFCVSF